jgi:hypothetical protein
VESAGCSDGKGYGDRDCDAAGVGDGELAGQSNFKRLAADVAECKLDWAARERDGGGAGEFADWFGFGFQDGSGGGEGAFEAEGAEGAVDVPAGADALDDLLAEVAAFGEVQGTGLGCFLGEFLVADVGAVAGGAFEETEGFESGLGDGGGSSFAKGSGDSSDGGRIGPELEARDDGAVRVEEGDFADAPGEGFELERCEAGWGERELLEQGWGPGAGEEESGAGGRDVGEFDVVHDDEAVEEGDEVGDLGGGGLEEEGFRFGKDVGVALDTALSVEDEVVVSVAGG